MNARLTRADYANMYMQIYDAAACKFTYSYSMSTIRIRLIEKESEQAH